MNLKRPNFITEEDIQRWEANINSDPYLPEDFANSLEFRELCYAGLWMYEELIKLGLNDADIGKLQYYAGKLSYHNDPWEVHQKSIEMYKAYVNETTIQSN